MTLSGWETWESNIPINFLNLIGGGMLAVIAVVGGIGALAYRRRQ